MTYQDQSNFDTNIAILKDLFRPLLPDETDFPSRHRNAQFDSYWLAVAAIVAWGWTRQTTLAERFHTACSVANQVLGRNYSGTRQGIQKAIRNLDQAFVQQVVQRFAEFTKTIKGHWSTAGKVNFAVDGTKFAAPRTAANQARFSAKATTKKRKQYRNKSAESKAATVQILATVIWHLGTGLPFRWSLDGSAGSERKNLASLLEQLPSNARLIGDAEYQGYSFWSAMIDSKKSFLVRVGSNVRFLKTLGKLNFRDGYVYYWPNSVNKREQPPLVFRLFQLHDGKKTIFVVTNELDMTDEQASELYRSRWNIEVFFRSVKQSCQRRKLCCRSPENLLAELNWTLLGIWASLSLGKTTLKQQGKPLSRLSPVQVIRVFYQTITAISLYANQKQTLLELLAKALIADESGRTTSKKSRRYPEKKKQHPCGKPKLTTATNEQKQQAKKYNV